MSSAGSHQEGLLARFASWFRGSELDRLDADDVERMAADIGLTGCELRDLAAKGPNGIDLLYDRMAVLGLTRADVERIAFGLAPDLEKDCACCSSKDVCAKDLVEHPAAPGWMSYCANAPSLVAAARMKGRVPI
jgi:uncharacterized protein YjiS (DUF1127 family)